ncbi:ATP-grasp domain-containing protein [Streptomyces niveiscabiei]|uniref:ATP-grasp domain-containing protein n=1 Tax=Streptomyces niveiscabiei TaxID=164115 RepID=UPI0006EBD3A9|nr:ATP-grasp domain-containing protein [Streptomyces niveiscabiei]
MSAFQVAVVDAFGTSHRYVDAFAAAGGEVVHVHSTPGLLPGVAPVDPARFSHTLHHEPDLDALTGRLAALRPRAVLPGRESGVELADALSERLGLPTNGTALSAGRRDKYVQIELLRAAGVPAARQLRTDDEDRLRTWHTALGKAAVVKPLRGALGHGVTFCDTPEDSAAALKALRNTVSAFGEPITEIVAQEYLIGAEYIVNTVSCDGVHHVTDVWSTDRVTANGVRDLVVAQILLRSDDPSVTRLVPYARQVLDALGVRYGPAHLEIKLTPDGPRLVEAGARPSGLPYHVADAIGEGQLEWSVDAYVRPDRFLARAGTPYDRRTAAAWAALVSPASGRLVAYRALDEVRALESLRELTLLVRPGEDIVATTWDLAYPAVLSLRHPVEAVLRRDLNTLRYLDGAGMYEIAPHVTAGNALP